MSNQEFLVRDTRLPRHFWADNEVVDVYGPQLGAHAFAVYMAMCRHAVNGSGEVRVSTRKIGRSIGMSAQGVLNALNHLERVGLLRQFEPGDRTRPAMYKLADVKALLDPIYAQLKLSPHGVNPVDTVRKGVNPVDTGVHAVDAGVHPVEGESIPWTRNKEDKTSSKLKTDKTKKRESLFLSKAEQRLRDNLAANHRAKQILRDMASSCPKCQGKGNYEHSGHPGQSVYCSCDLGLALRVAEAHA